MDQFQAVYQGSKPLQVQPGFEVDIKALCSSKLDEWEPDRGSQQPVAVILTRHEIRIVRRSQKSEVMRIVSEQVKLVVTSRNNAVALLLYHLGELCLVVLRVVAPAQAEDVCGRMRRWLKFISRESPSMYANAPGARPKKDNSVQPSSSARQSSLPAYGSGDASLSRKDSGNAVLSAGAFAAVSAAVASCLTNLEFSVPNTQNNGKATLQKASVHAGNSTTASSSAWMRMRVDTQSKEEPKSSSLSDAQKRKGKKMAAVKTTDATSLPCPQEGLGSAMPKGDSIEYGNLPWQMAARKPAAQPPSLSHLRPLKKEDAEAVSCHDGPSSKGSHVSDSAALSLSPNRKPTASSASRSTRSVAGPASAQSLREDHGASTPTTHSAMYANLSFQLVGETISARSPSLSQVPPSKTEVETLVRHDDPRQVVPRPVLEASSNEQRVSGDDAVSPSQAMKATLIQVLKSMATPNAPVATSIAQLAAALTTLLATPTEPANSTPQAPSQPARSAPARSPSPGQQPRRGKARTAPRRTAPPLTAPAPPQATTPATIPATTPAPAAVAVKAPTSRETRNPVSATKTAVAPALSAAKSPVSATETAEARAIPAPRPAATTPRARPLVSAATAGTARAIAAAPAAPRPAATATVGAVTATATSTPTLASSSRAKLPHKTIPARCHKTSQAPPSSPQSPPELQSSDGSPDCQEQTQNLPRASVGKQSLIQSPEGADPQLSSAPRRSASDRSPKDQDKLSDDGQSSTSSEDEAVPTPSPAEAIVPAFGLSCPLARSSAKDKSKSVRARVLEKLKGKKKDKQPTQQSLQQNPAPGRLSPTQGESFCVILPSLPH